jgi:hypothetical protein
LRAFAPKNLQTVENDRERLAVFGDFGLALQTHSRGQFHSTDYLGFDGLSVWEFLEERVEIGEVVVPV